MTKSIFRVSQEKRLEKKLTEKVKALGGMPIKFPALFVSGFPDRIILMPGGRMYFVEMKDTKKGLDSLQRYWSRVLTGMGFDVRKVNTDESLTEFVNHIAV